MSVFVIRTDEHDNILLYSWKRIPANGEHNSMNTYDMGFNDHMAKTWKIRMRSLGL